MTYLGKGMAAGFAAAAALAALLQLNAEYGYLPELDFAAMLGGLTGTGAAGGWVLHFLVGTLWGALFAWLDPDLPGDSLRQRGIVFGGVAWLAMMFLLMPLAGFGIFGLGYGVMLPLAALGLHLVFGAIMGGAYGWLILQAIPLRYREPPPADLARTSLAARAVQEAANRAVQSLDPEKSRPAITLAVDNPPLGPNIKPAKTAKARRKSGAASVSTR